MPYVTESPSPVPLRVALVVKKRIVDLRQVLGRDPQAGVGDLDLHAEARLPTP